MSFTPSDLSRDCATKTWRLLVSEGWIWLIIAFWFFLRFLFLEVSPPGFFIDESSGFGLAGCIRDAAPTIYAPHSTYPFFAQGVSGGIIPPPLLYIGAGWMKFFGSSIASLRSIAALFSGLTLVGLYFLARELGGRKFALSVLLVAAVSPWAFHFSRIGWNPPMMPFGIVWGVFFLYRFRSLWDAILAGFFFSFASYSYSAGMILCLALPPCVLLLHIVQRRFSLRLLSVFVLSGIVFCLPLVLYTLSEMGQRRFNTVAIFSPEYLKKEHAGSYLAGAFAVLENIALYFSPEFLIFDGDALLRHSIPGFGQFSYLDLLGLAALPLIFLGGFVRVCTTGFNRSFWRQWIQSPVTSIIYLGFIGYLIGIIPSALTWDSQPHALRALAAWPFAALLSGFGIHCILRRGLCGHLLTLSAGIAFSYFYLFSFFIEYPGSSSWWFDVEKVEFVRRCETEACWSKFAVSEETSSAVYFLMHFRHMTCQEAKSYHAQQVAAHRLRVK